MIAHLRQVCEYIKDIKAMSTITSKVQQSYVLSVLSRITSGRDMAFADKSTRDADGYSLEPPPDELTNRLAQKSVNLIATSCHRCSAAATSYVAYKGSRSRLGILDRSWRTRREALVYDRRTYFNSLLQQHVES